MSFPDWRPLFPLDRPRPEQELAIDFIIDQFYVQNKDYVVCELPTGTGKSAIAITLARWLRRWHMEMLQGDALEETLPQTYVLTSQKVLQDQYVKDFPTHLADLRSSANFQCRGMKGQTCAETKRLKKALEGNPCLSVINCIDDAKGCPYRAAKQKFIEATASVTNYSYMLSEAVYAGSLKPRELIVFDEAHNIENEVRRWAQISIYEGYVSEELKISFPNSENDVKGWVENRYYPALLKLMSRNLRAIEKLMAAGKLSNRLQELAKKHELLDKHVCQVNRFVQEKGADKDEYLVTIDRSGAERSVQLRPLSVASQAQSLLYSKGRKRLLMSATILDEDVFFRSAGLPSKQSAAFLSIASPFKPTSFGLTYRPIGSMTAKNVATTLPNIVADVRKILAKHPTQKGVIHTTSYDVTSAIGTIGNDRLLVQTCADDREKMLREHLSSPRPTVLVSPAMTEGLDLRDELGRFQVICKVPYPYFGDKVVATKAKKDPKWYAWCTVRTLVQAVGRCVRSTNDWTKTYILDESFGELIQRNPEMIPSYFEELEFEDASKDA